MVLVGDVAHNKRMGFPCSRAGVPQKPVGQRSLITCYDSSLINCIAVPLWIDKTWRYTHAKGRTSFAACQNKQRESP